jgi:hypothetical protein
LLFQCCAVISVFHLMRGIFDPALKEALRTGTEPSAFAVIPTTTSLDTSSDGDMVQIPNNLRLLFLGDSISRYQYINLVYFLHKKRWIEDHETPNPCVEKKYSSWVDFCNQTNLAFDGKEQCDCFRPPIKRERAKRSFDARYYADHSTGNYISTIQKFGHHLA